MRSRLSLLLLSSFLILQSSFSQSVSVLPQPIEVMMKHSTFTLKPSTTFVLANSREVLQPIVEQFAERWRVATGFSLLINPGRNITSTVDVISVSIDPKQKALGNEGYSLVVEPQKITIAAPKTAGIFYALQTLRQLLPPEIESSSIMYNRVWQVPCVKITDKPRFTWRGMHLDVCRHFFPKEFVKRYIDVMAAYKLNTFHWHLTEDQGWRIEIKKYPRLTEVGSRRKETKDDGIPHGGFYTQEEVKEIVEYAKRRFITVVPEIEMPGHALASLASYPEFSCTGGPHEVATTWGVFDDVYCAGNDKTFEFLRNVIGEVAALFPGKYFHIGGDECPKTRWKACDKCQQRIKSQRLKDESELQSYFVRRIEKIVRAKGKRLIGWDEILEGGLAPNATVMSWRGVKGGIEAARQKHDVVMSPGTHCYFDHYQGKQGEPKAIGGFTPLERIYDYEPIPDSLTPAEAKHILGAQANMWTEYIDNARHVEYMLMPRMCALSEVVWSPKELRNFGNFERRMARHYERLSQLDVNYRIPPPKELGGRGYLFGDSAITLSVPIPDAKIVYTFDGMMPGASSKHYTTPVQVTDGITLTARTLMPDGRLSNAVKTTYTWVDRKVNGVGYSYFEGVWDSLPDFSTHSPVRTGTIYGIGLDGLEHRENEFGLQLRTSIGIATEGEYTFFLTCDDGGTLSIDGKLLVNNDGLHGPRERSGTIKLKPGVHTITVEYFDRDGDETLGLSYEGPGIGKQEVHPRMLLKE